MSYVDAGYAICLSVLFLYAGLAAAPPAPPGAGPSSGRRAARTEGPAAPGGPGER